eukprot:1187335-Prorocentrum_minimum.AAC.3
MECPFAPVAQVVAVAALQPKLVAAQAGEAGTKLAAPHKIAVPASHQEVPASHKESIAQKLSRSGYTQAAERLSKLEELKAKHNPAIIHSHTNVQVPKHTSMKVSEPFSCVPF